MIKLDAVDKRLLGLLQNNSNINVKEISADLKLTKTPIYERIRRYEKVGLVKKYVAVLDVSKIENLMVVFCSVSLESQKLEGIEEFNQAVEKIPEVIDC